MSTRFEIEFAADAQQDLAALSAYDQAIVLDAIEVGLRFQPTTITRNRKPLVPVGAVAEAGITWELRVGAFRIFYDVIPPTLVVVIRVVHKGRKTTEGSL